MLVYGKKGRKAPYVISMITKMQLGSLLLFSIEKSFQGQIQITIRGLILLFFSDVSRDWQFGFQEPASSIMEGIIDLHHDIMFFIVWIIVAVIWVMFELLRGFNTQTKNEFSSLPKQIQHHTFLEIIWTVLPCVILLLIAIPSFSLLYAIEDFNVIESTIKVIGNQWYWSYEFPGDGFEKTFDSVMISEIDLENGLRLLEVDNRLVLPIEKQIRLFITSTDVLHSWAIPSLGIKMDACPGRLNQVALWINRKGVYYGQCSEICGINHSFMPIVVQAVDETTFFEWFLSDSPLLKAVKVAI